MDKQSKGEFVDLGNKMNGVVKASDWENQFAKIRANSVSLADRECEGVGCKNILTYRRNFRNVMCWNCLYKISLRNGRKDTADFIAENYL